MTPRNTCFVSGNRSLFTISPVAEARVKLVPPSRGAKLFVALTDACSRPAPVRTRPELFSALNEQLLSHSFTHTASLTHTHECCKNNLFSTQRVTSHIFNSPFIHRGSAGNVTKREVKPKSSQSKRTLRTLSALSAMEPHQGSVLTHIMSAVTRICIYCCLLSHLLSSST